MTAKNEQLARIRTNLTDFFSITELQSMTFDLQVDYDKLDGNNKEAKTRSLIEYFLNRQNLHALCALASRLRPKLDWSYEDSSLENTTIASLSDEHDQQRTKVFITYCHEDVDEDVLDYMEHLLKENSQQQYEILLDKHLNYGEDIATFMAHLKKVDAVIIFMSPAYKRKVSERKGGVYDEYKIISTRYSEVHGQLKEGKKISEIDGYFELIPILISGDHNSSVLEDISHLKYLDLVGLRVSRNLNSNFITTDYTKTKFVPAITKIVDRLRVISTFKNPEFEKTYKKYYKELFLELKANWTDSADSLSSLLVKTRVYRKVEQQSIYFLIGRKGSGKSTVTDALAIRQKKHYKDHVAIIANNYALEFAYSLLSVDQILSDISIVVNRGKLFQYIWEVVFYLRCMEVLIKLFKNNELTEYQSQFLLPIEQQIKQIYEQHDAITQDAREETCFIYALNSAMEFLNDCIHGARNDKKFFYSDIKARFTKRKILEFALSAEALDAFEKIIYTCRKKFLITLDGFDSQFDEFRRHKPFSTRELQRRTSFENDWLRALLLLVLEAKQRNRDCRFHQLIDFCITVPKDRFFEVLASERDSYRYINHFSSLDWSGIELSILLRKRLELLSGTRTDKQKSAYERLDWILKNRFGHIPIQINFEYNGKDYSMPLFLYVLRHTFWRPRDVLLYYAKIISSCDDLQKKGLKITSETLRRSIKDATYQVINQEFIEEFKMVVMNLNEIINSFTHTTQFISFEKIGNILSKIDFKFASNALRAKTIDDKIEFLYQIGFIGIHATKELRARYHFISEHAFFFNEGLSFLKTVSENRFKDFEFIIHPVFFEYLQLDTGNRELVLNLNWDYLQQMEILLSAGGLD